MWGADHQQSELFSYISAERRVPEDHPLRAIRAMVDVALRNMGPQFDAMYAKVGRPSIAPEKLLRALLLQVLYTVRSERMLMEQLNYNLLFRSVPDDPWEYECGLSRGATEKRHKSFQAGPRRAAGAQGRG